MNRCKDYACFIVWFAGLSYMALWPLTAHGNGGVGLGADWKLPPTLHALGLIASFFVLARIAAIAFARFRPRRAAQPPPTVAADLLETRLNARRWKAPSAQSVKPRAQFGLRGTEH